MTAPHSSADGATITVDELRAQLERGAPLTVLDLRTASDRAEWAIPDRQHADVHDALWAGDPVALAAPLSAVRAATPLLSADEAGANRC